MIGNWRKINIDEYIENLKGFYSDSSKGSFRSTSIVDSLNQEEIIYLNQNLHLDQLVGVEKKYILNKLLQDKTKYNFVKYILITSSIELEVNNVDETNKSLFELLIESMISANEPYNHYQFVLLYNRGYINTKLDEDFLINFYKTKITSQQIFELWCMARVCYKLNNQDKIEKAFHKDRVILSLLSFKQGRPVGFNFPNLLGVANNAIKHYREQGDLILYAMRYYKVYEDIKQRDKKGSFRQKESDFKEFKPIQDVEFNEIAYEIFPELKH